jgi:H+/gluconate symporter-like permease
MMNVIIKRGGVKMKQVFDYINSNSFLTSIIGVIIGWLLTTLTTIFINNRNNKERRKEESDREKRKQYENKAELLIDNNMEDNGLLPVIKIFLSEILNIQKIFLIAKNINARFFI